ncbi:hypothetical protein [Brachybacterium hainanense]|uniref:Cardiolipin synthase N-terminal domain-containing protein n=1 Tax=Brachybacterium hainanense TaxID=1541174 RepID=A0ABV6RCC6_9MICO
MIQELQELFTDLDDAQLFGLGAVGLVALAAVVCLVLWIATLFSVLGSTYGGGMKLLLIILCFAFPVLGPLAWFVIVKGNQPSYRYAYRR